MMQKYICKTIFTDKKNLAPEQTWPIGIDYGFSAVKGYSKNKIFSFPNAAVRIPDGQTIIEASEQDIVLRKRNADGLVETWLVGTKAQEVMNGEEAMNLENEMYGRNRYFSPSFQTILMSGIGMALMNGSFGEYKGERVVIQTGLPPRYLNEDRDMLREVLSGEFSFSLKLGNKAFQHFVVNIRPEDVYVMSQPMGSLFSAVTENDGRRSEADKRILAKKNIVVMDPGFRTLDMFSIINGILSDEANTFDIYGMHEVYKRTVQELTEKYGAKISIPLMPKALQDGYVTAFDRRARRMKRVEFEEILLKYTKEVCGEAVAKVDGIYDYLQGYDYLLVTGGTGDAWLAQIRDSYKDFEGLEILAANRHDEEVPNIFSNVRGYYLRIVKQLIKAEKDIKRR